MDRVNLAAELAPFGDHWQPRTVARFNDCDVMVVKAQGEFVWHKHDDTATEEVHLLLFERVVRQAFADRPGFTCERQPTGATLAILARFRSLELPVEVFGQAVPVDQQRGYRHLLVEARLLELGGPRLRRAVLDLRGKGTKTEPAFAHALGLSGDPHERLWALSWCDDAELRVILGASDPRPWSSDPSRTPGSGVTPTS